MEVELYRPFCQNVGSRVVPAYAWTEEIIGDYVENDVPGLSQIIILNQKDENVSFSKAGNRKVKGIPGRRP